MGKPAHRYRGNNQKKPAGKTPFRKKVSLITLTSDEIDLFRDALQLLKVVSSARSEALSGTDRLIEVTALAEQRLAHIQSHGGAFYFVAKNDYVVMNAALLIFLQILRFMPELLSEGMDKYYTEARLLALQKKIAPSLSKQTGNTSHG